MKELIFITVVMAAIAGLTGCEHVNFEIDWKPLLESAAAYFQK